MEDCPDCSPEASRGFVGRTSALHMLVILGCLVIVFHPLVVRDSLPGDLDNLYFLYAQRALIHHGEGVFWNPYQFSGFAAYRDPNLSIFYPPSWLYRVLPLRETFVVMIFGHYLFAGAGLLWLGYRLGLSPMPRLVGALSFCLGSYLLGRFLNHSLLVTACFAPWVFGSFHEAIERGSPRWVGISAVLLALQFLSGMPHNGAFMMIALAMYGLWRAVENRSIVPLLFGCGALLLASGLAAVQLVPTLAGIQEAVRQKQTIAQAGDLALGPGWIPEFLLGGTDRWQEAINEFLATTCYPAVPIVLLAPFAFLGRRWRLAAYLAALALLAVLLALGPQTPVYRWFFHLPGGRFFNIPGRFLYLAAWAFPVLGALGVERLLDRRAGDVWINRIVAVMFGAALVLLVALSVVDWHGLWKAAARPRLIAGEAFMLANLALFGTPATGVLLGYRTGMIGRRLLCLALPAVVVLDLLHFSTRLKREYVRTDDVTASRTIKEAERLCREHGPCRILGYQGNFSRPLSANERISPALMVPKLANLHRLQDVQGFSPLHTLRYNEVVHASAGSVRGTPVLRWVLAGSARARILDLLGMRYIIGEPYDASAIANQRRLQPGESFDVILDTGGRSVRELLLVSCSDSGSHLPTGAKVAEVTVKNASGATRRIPIRAGIETADFRLSFPGVSGNHEPAPIHRTVPLISEKGVFSGRVFISRISFDEIADPSTLGIRNVSPKSLFVVLEASLTFTNDGQFRRIFDVEGVRLYENARAFPRAWWVEHAIPVESATSAHEMLVRGEFDPAKCVLVESGRPGQFGLPPDLTGDTGNTPIGVDVIEWRPGYLEVEVNAPRAGYLVASEMDDFGWRVSVNGERTDRVRANAVMMAVPVEAGLRRVRFRFVPVDAWAGGAVSLIALLLLAVILRRGGGARDGKA